MMVYAKKTAKKPNSKMDDVQSTDKGPDTKMDEVESTDKEPDTKKADAKSRVKSRVKRVHETMVSCRPIRLVQLIEKLNEEQVAAVKKIGFGGLLELKISNFPLAHVRLFLDSFSDGSFVFRASRNEEFMISKHDVHDCFLIPFGPNLLPLVPTGSQKGSNSPENKALKDKWRQAYGVEKASSSINLGKVKKELEEYKEADDHFCRLFVLFCMSLFLAPTPNNGIDLKLLRAVEDPQAIPHFDWCSYVLESLVKAGSKAGSDLEKAATMLGGCIPFLMITYFQRYDYRGSPCAHDLPLIKHWDEERLASRIKFEVSIGGLGRLTLSEVKYPRCLQGPSSILSLDSITISDSGELKLLLPPPPPPPPSRSIPEKKFIQIELPPGVEDDQELKARAVNRTHELYLQMQRNAIVFYSWYADVTARIKCATSDPTGPSPSQASQEFFEGEKVQQYVAEVEYIAERLKVSVANAPAFQEGDRKSPKPDDEIDASTRQISEVLSNLANDRGGRDQPCAGMRGESDKADAPMKSVAVSWSQIMGGATVDSIGVANDSLGLEDQDVHSSVQTERELLLEAKYTEEIDLAFRGSEAGLVQGDEVHDQVHGAGMKKTVRSLSDDQLEEREAIAVNDQPSEEKSAVSATPMDTQQMMECMYSTVEMNEALRGPPVAGSGPVAEVTVQKAAIENVEQQSVNVGENVVAFDSQQSVQKAAIENVEQHSVNMGENIVAVDGVKVNPGDQSTEWSPSQHAFVQNDTPHLETDHIAKAASLGHKNVAPSGLPASHPSNTSILNSKRKLLILDVNGLLGHVVDRNKVHKRPFCDDFLKFCIEKFNVGIWSSRNETNLKKVLGHLMENNIENKLVFCWNQEQCTRVGDHEDNCKNKCKPLFLKELKKLWNKTEESLPWEKGFYDETNTILLDDSPCKALRNPPYTAVFPPTYTSDDKEDKSLGSDGDIRIYLERVAAAENVQKFIQENPLASAIKNTEFCRFVKKK